MHSCIYVYIDIYVYVHVHVDVSASLRAVNSVPTLRWSVPGTILAPSHRKLQP